MEMAGQLFGKRLHPPRRDYVTAPFGFTWFSTADLLAK
jgi:hypothetical protein